MTKDIYKWWSRKKLKGEILKLKLTYNELFDAMLKTQEENKELREKNAKLKKGLKISQRCWQDQKNISLNANCSLHKAKELIKEMLSILPKENIEGVYEITEEAEEFLREVEE